MPSPADRRRLVEHRAGARCEYCRMHQSLQGARFHVEHIIPKSRRGNSDMENLAFACPGCNLHKSDRIEAIEPNTCEMAPLFHPRQDSWSDHFEWDEYKIVGLTDIGRATVTALEMNHIRRVQIRKAEQTFGLFPPEIV